MHAEPLLMHEKGLTCTFFAILCTNLRFSASWQVPDFIGELNRSLKKFMIPVMAKVIPLFKDYTGTGQSSKPRLDLNAAHTITGIVRAEPMESPDAFYASCIGDDGQMLGRPRIPLNRRFYCVYEDGLAVYNHQGLTNCLRYIANRLNTRTGFATMKQAMDAGFEVRAV